MKGFIEVTRVNTHKELINIEEICSVQEPIEGNTDYKSYIFLLNGFSEGFMESYDEVKALIEKAQGEKPTELN